MRLFILYLVKRTLGYLGIIGLFYVAVAAILSHFSRMEIRDDISVLLCGHSLVANAYNDRELLNVQNIAQEGESFFYTYIKLKKIIDETEGIKHVYIDVSTNYFVKGNDRKIWKDNTLIGFLPRYLPFMTFEEYFFLLKKNFKGTLKYSLKSPIKWAYVFYNKLSYDNKLLGGYLPRKGAFDCDSYQKNPITLDFSNHEIVNLQNIYTFLLKNKISITFLETPVSKCSIWRNHRVEIRTYLQDQFPLAKLLTMESFNATDENFWNHSHLNEIGSQYFTDFLLKQNIFRPSAINEVYIENNTN